VLWMRVWHTARARYAEPRLANTKAFWKIRTWNDGEEKRRPKRPMRCLHGSSRGVNDHSTVYARVPSELHRPGGCPRPPVPRVLWSGGAMVVFLSHRGSTPTPDITVVSNEERSLASTSLRMSRVKVQRLCTIGLCMVSRRETWSRPVWTRAATPPASQ
jgi:hypothetical protein